MFDERLAEKLKSYDERLKTLETVDQPSFDDWVRFSYDTVTLDSDCRVTNLITFTFNNIKPGDFVSTGFVVRLKQGGDFIYGYVIRASTVTGEMDILTDSDNTISTVTSVTDLSYAKNKNASGFPQLMNYVPTWTKFAGSGSLTVNNRKGQFSIEGNLLKVFAFGDLNYSATDKPVFICTMPLYVIGYGDLNNDGVVNATDSSFYSTQLSNANSAVYDLVLTFPDKYYPMYIFGLNNVNAFGRLKAAPAPNVNDEATYLTEFLDNASSLLPHRIHVEVEYAFTTIGEVRNGH